ncbi:hypothetical protein GGF46_003435 [Coemansia sp. RSA 552]|nr:hypothetical protein GGF46_003435 [Coemansia sp. RSA 552]
MGLTSSLLRVLRYSLYLGIIFLAVIELIVDAVALGGLNSQGGLVSLSAERGAAGYTMFVTILTLLVIPLVAFGTLLASMGMGFASSVNRIGTELSVAGAFTVLWFVSGVVMAVKADVNCRGVSVCQKFKAATAFAWIPWLFFVGLSGVLVLILMRIRASGGNMQSLAYDIDGEANQPQVPPQAAGAPQHMEATPQHMEAGAYSPQSTGKYEGDSYYQSNPAVNMPAAPK